MTFSTRKAMHMNIDIPEEMLPDSTFACGPSQGHPDIRKTSIGDMLFERSHRAPDISSEGLYAQTLERIRQFLQIPDDYLAFFFLGGATPALDAAAWNLTKDSISGYRFGAFSNLWGRNIASAVPGIVSTTYADLEEGEMFPSAELDLEASFIFMTPNETSTGVMIPNDTLEDVHENASEDSLTGWDCTSCAGGRILPRGRYDVMVFSLQKCFGCPGGTGVMVLSPEAAARANEVSQMRTIPHSLKLAGEKKAIDRVSSKSQTVNTPNTPAIWMANEATRIMLEAGGIEAMDALVKRHADLIWKWAERSDYLEPYVDDERFRSDITITLRVDESLDAADISKALAATGRPNLQDGIKKYSAVKGNVIRIGCFPFIDFEGTGEFEKLTDTVDYIVERLAD